MVTETDGRILIVDDEESACRLLAQILTRNGYACETAEDAGAAREALQRMPADVVLTDMSMPGDTGVDLIGDIVAEYPGTAVIMVTGFDDQALGQMALQMGAYGYVIKPFRATEIVIAVANSLRRRDLELALKQQNQMLERLVEARTADLKASREETIHRLVLAAESRDNTTADHVERMSHYSSLIARGLGADEPVADEIRLASLMHDVGKMGVPDHILQKPGRLTDEEWAVMRSHAEVGHRILRDSGSDLLENAATVALTHHERFDGKGYPNGLAGEEIPMIGRIAAVADVFDALTTDRPYREALPLDVAKQMLIDGRGHQFDPDPIDIFFAHWEEVLSIDQVARSDDRSALERRGEHDRSPGRDFQFGSKAV